MPSQTKITELLSFIVTGFNAGKDITSLGRSIASFAHVLPPVIASIIKLSLAGIELLINTAAIIFDQNKSGKERAIALATLMGFMALTVAISVVSLLFPALPMVVAGLVLTACVADFAWTAFDLYKLFSKLHKNQTTLTSFSDKNSVQSIQLQNDIAELKIQLKVKALALVGSLVSVVGSILLFFTAPVIAVAATAVFLASSVIGAAVSVMRLAFKIQKTTKVTETPDVTETPEVTQTLEVSSDAKIISALSHEHSNQRMQVPANTHENNFDQLKKSELTQKSDEVGKMAGKFNKFELVGKNVGDEDQKSIAEQSNLPKLRVGSHASH